MGNTQAHELFQTTIRQLASRPVDPSLDEFWNRFWTIPRSREDITTLLTNNDISNVINSQPANFTLLLNKLTDQLAAVNSNKNRTPVDFWNAMNCVRMLARLIPLAFQHNLEIFWVVPTEEEAEPPQSIVHPPVLLQADGTKEAVPSDPESKIPTDAEPEPKVKPDSEAKESEGILEALNLPEGRSQNSAPPKEPRKPLGARIIDNLIGMLFLPGYTMLEQKKLEPGEGEGLIGSVAFSFQSTMNTPRTEIILCLIACLSSPLFVSPKHEELIEENLFHPIKNTFLEYLVGNDSEHIPYFLSALLQACTAYDPVGWGVPYNHVVFTDTQEQLMDSSLQLLCLLLDFRSFPLQKRKSTQQQSEIPHIPPSPVKNLFVEHIRSIRSPTDFAVIYDAICQKMENPLTSKNTYLPYSRKKIGCHQELTILFWNLIHISPHFLAWILQCRDLTTLIYPMVHFLNEGRNDASQFAFIHLAVFILFSLSNQREFSVQLNRKFEKTLYTDVQGDLNLNYADFLISTLCRLITDGHERLRSIWEYSLIIVSNISAFIKILSKTTAHRLTTLFTHVTGPRALFSDYRIPQLCVLLLETFNNILQYQYEGNFTLMYSLIRSRTSFQKLMRLCIVEPQFTLREDAVGSDVKDESGHKLDLKEENLGTVGNPAKEEIPQIVIEEPQKADDKGKGVKKPVRDGEPKKGSESEPRKEQEPKAEPKKESENKQTEDSEKKPEPEIPQEKQVKHWVPTNEWLTQWQQTLPIQSVLAFISAVLPKIKPLIKKTANDEQIIYDFLASFTLVGILPVPHPIIQRPFIDEPSNIKFVTEFLWGVIFLRTLQTEMFRNLEIKLFRVDTK